MLWVWLISTLIWIFLCNYWLDFIHYGHYRRPYFPGILFFHEIFVCGTQSSDCRNVPERTMNKKNLSRNSKSISHVATSLVLPWKSLSKTIPIVKTIWHHHNVASPEDLKSPIKFDATRHSTSYFLVTRSLLFSINVSIEGFQPAANNSVENCSFCFFIRKLIVWKLHKVHIASTYVDSQTDISPLIQVWFQHEGLERTL